ncbi:hypothetical protein D3C76_1430830 [compost metagenome]
MPRHVAVERRSVQAAVDVVEGLGLGVGVSRKQLQALDDFPTELRLETLRTYPAGVDVAVTIG